MQVLDPPLLSSDLVGWHGNHNRPRPLSCSVHQESGPNDTAWNSRVFSVLPPPPFLHRAQTKAASQNNMPLHPPTFTPLEATVWVRTHQTWTGAVPRSGQGRPVQSTECVHCIFNECRHTGCRTGWPVLVCGLARPANGSKRGTA